MTYVPESECATHYTTAPHGSAAELKASGAEKATAIMMKLCDPLYK